MYKIECRHITIKQNGSERMAEETGEDMANRMNCTAQVWLLIGNGKKKTWLLLHTFNPETIQ